MNIEQEMKNMIKKNPKLAVELRDETGRIDPDSYIVKKVKLKQLLSLLPSNTKPIRSYKLAKHKFGHGKSPFQKSSEGSNESGSASADTNGPKPKIAAKPKI